MKATTIGVAGGPLSAGIAATFAALGRALGISLEPRTFGDDRGVDAWIVLAADRQAVADLSRTHRPCYVVLAHPDAEPVDAPQTVTFNGHAAVDPVLRGRRITVDDAAGAIGMPAWLSGAEPLAAAGGVTVWAAREAGACRHHFVTLAPPALQNGEALFAQFSGPRIARLLPLVTFLQSVEAAAGWHRPPLFASFMFDDPNLHWPSYGFIKYPEMVEHAAAGRYHVSIATIPLDAWFVHRRASAIFRDNRAHLSLLCHGNDHMFRELARSHSTVVVRRLMCQALGRVSEIERRTGLEVARVMAPPHGACNETALDQMAVAGFEAVCVSRGSLRHHNPLAEWMPSLGMKPCDMVAGLPVIPRFGLSRNCRNDILVAALLRQPIVPMTHHRGVADGYDLLDDTAAFVHSLGDVRWRDMQSIARSLYSCRRDADTLRVRMLTNRASVPVPAGVTAMSVEAAASDQPHSAPLFWRTAAGDSRWMPLLRPAPISVRPGTTIEIAAGQVYLPNANAHTPGPRHLVPSARRLLTEARDRVLPSFHRARLRIRSVNRVQQ